MGSGTILTQMILKSREIAMVMLVALSKSRSLIANEIFEHNHQKLKQASFRNLCQIQPSYK